MMEKERGAGLLHQSAAPQPRPLPGHPHSSAAAPGRGDQPLARLLTLPEFILRLYNLFLRLLRIN